jgi:hypothetical protein
MPRQSFQFKEKGKEKKSVAFEVMELRLRGLFLGVTIGLLAPRICLLSLAPNSVNLRHWALHSLGGLVGGEAGIGLGQELKRAFSLIRLRNSGADSRPHTSRYVSLMSCLDAREWLQKPHVC